MPSTSTKSIKMTDPVAQHKSYIDMPPTSTNSIKIAIVSINAVNIMNKYINTNELQRN